MIGPHLENRAWWLLFLCWLIAGIATLGSLFFSEVMGRIPCELCWYQRMFMFPLVLVLSVGLLTSDWRCRRYALPIAAAGWGVALYHCLLYMKLIPAPARPCSQGISCADVTLELYGFVTIPLLSLLVFSLLVGLLVALRNVRTQ